MNLPVNVKSARLRLPLITPAEALAMRRGERDPHWDPDYPRPDDVDAASMAREGDTWGPRHIVRAFDERVVGSIGFFGPPIVDEGRDETPETEVGYGLVTQARGHGAASEALAAMLVETDRLGVRIRASVAPENTASVRVLAKAGFTGLRGTDEEGHLVMVRPVGLSPAAAGSAPTP